MKKVLYLLGVGICLLVWWRVQFKDEFQVPQEIAVPAGTTQFVANMEEIQGIGVSNLNVTLEEPLENDGADLTIYITDEAGSVYTLTEQNKHIHTNGYTNMESGTIEGLPVVLRVGETYAVSYDCRMADGTSVTELSLMLYGPERSTNRESFLLFAVAFVIIVVATLTDNETGFIGVLALLLMLNGILLPTLDTKTETSAFAKVYAASGKILEKDSLAMEVVERESVLLDENGLQNDNYLTYRIPLHRFWTFDAYGNERDTARESVKYRIAKTGSRRVSLMQWPAVMGVFLARKLRLSYQMIRMAGSICNAILGLLIIGIVQVLARKRRSIQRLVRMICLLPAVQLQVISYETLWDKLMKIASGGVRGLFVNWDTLISNAVVYDGLRGNIFIVTYVLLGMVVLEICGVMEEGGYRFKVWNPGKLAGESHLHIMEQIGVLCSIIAVLTRFAAM